MPHGAFCFFALWCVSGVYTVRFCVLHQCDTKKAPKLHDADSSFAPECKKAECTVRHLCRVGTFLVTTLASSALLSDP
ncbi:unnamed protein product [Caenorhabditis auriculariae]|uniref:Secreted protein n=1 Tax=Caenorhabditis auriculariae TaxID=2777116 RepID=A0A8S1GRI4_9PELO|nr:unnamed protein product [Caenorhabditis auriculariae]